MGREDVHLIDLPADRWREYRALRLTALKTDPLAYGSTYEESVTYDDAYWQDRLTNPASLFLFAERGGALIGMVGALLRAEVEPATAHIVGVFVEPAHRGQGVARLLLNKLLARLAARPDIARVRLGVTETQNHAIALYRSLGFAAVGRLPGEIKRGDRTDDELVMERDNY